MQGSISPIARKKGNSHLAAGKTLFFIEKGRGGRHKNTRGGEKGH